MRRLLELSALAVFLLLAGLFSVPVSEALVSLQDRPEAQHVYSVRGCVSCLDDPFLAFALRSDAIPFEEYAFLTLGLANQTAWNSGDVDWIIRAFEVTDHAKEAFDGTVSDRRRLLADIVRRSLDRGVVLEPDERTRLVALLEAIPSTAQRPDVERVW